MLQLVECPRDAMQGIKLFIPTDLKVKYLNALLKVGFHTLDFGSFVSPKAIPQLRDTHQVVSQLEMTDTHLLSIVANVRGAEEAVRHEEIKYIGFPFSISETFQLRNTRATIDQSLERVKHIQSICLSNNKVLVVYISMGFGNPYGDVWSEEIVSKWVEELIDLDITIIALSDTIGVANPASISRIFSHLVPAYASTQFGAHFHTRPDMWKEKVLAATEAGCTRFDGAIGGFGGCPMAKDELVGNMPMESLLDFFDQNVFESDEWMEVVELNTYIFSTYTT